MSTQDSGFVSPTRIDTPCVQEIENDIPVYEDMAALVPDAEVPHVQFPCPECEVLVPLPDGGVDELQSCSLIKTMQEVTPSTAKPEAKQRNCNHCESKPPKVKCVDCQMFFCDGCHDAHNWRKANLKHKVKILGKASSTRTKRVSKSKSKNFDGAACKTHRRKEAVAFCGVCSVMVCSGCLADDHSSHRTQRIEAVAKRHRDHLQYLVSGVRESIDDISTSVKQLELYATNCTGNKDTVLAQLDEQKKLILAKLAEHFDGMKRTVSEDCKEEVQKVNLKKTDLKQSQARLEQGIVFADNLLLHGRDGDVIQVLTAVRSSIRRMRTTTAKTDQDTRLEMMYRPAALTEDTISRTVGAIHMTQVPLHEDVPTSAKYNDVLCEIPQDQCEPILSHSFKAKTFKDSNGCKPTGLAVLPNSSLFIVDDINKKVKRFDQHGRLLWECHPEGDRALVDPWDIALTHDEHLVVTDRNRGKVKVFDCGGEFLYEFGKHLLSAWGVAVNSQNEIIVTDALQQNVFVHDAQGTILLTLPNKTHRDASLFLCPEYVAVGQNDDIIVSDFEKHCILVFDYVGQLLFSFGTRGNGVGHLDVPCGVCVDVNGDILVSDYNNQRVVKVSRNGQHLGCLATRAHGLVLPQAVAYTTNNQMIVLDRADVKVFRFTVEQEPEHHVVFDEPPSETQTLAGSTNGSCVSVESVTSVTAVTSTPNLSSSHEDVLYDVPSTLPLKSASFETEV